MAKPEFVQIVLTCGSWQEAQRIVDRLLELRLIACAECIPIKSKFAWKSGWDESEEIKLVMESASHLFDGIETEVKKLHSYETYVLQSVKVDRLSHEAAQWWESVIQPLASQITEAG